MRLADLCSGYGGASLALEPLGFETVLLAEIDKDACKVLDRRFPGVPNVGDIKTADWEPWRGQVDALVAGFPCQPASSAGRRKGMDDERWLWDDLGRAIRLLRPRFVLLENVPGLLSVDDGRAFNAVLSELATSGYVGRFLLLPASSVGACHRRERLFVAATDASCPPGWEVARGAHGDEGEDERWPAHGAHQSGGRGEAPAHPAGIGRIGTADLRESEAALLKRAALDGRVRAEGLNLLPTPQTNYTGSSVEAWRKRRPAGNGATREAVGDLQLAVNLLPTPRCSDANGRGQHGQGGLDLRTTVAESLLVPQLSRSDGNPRSGMHSPVERWGKFAAAIARHEAVFGRTAPEPLVGKSLSPVFVEWMMGLPEGWVTDCGISRTAALRVLGNGIVPLHAQAAWGALLARMAEQVAA